MVHFFYTQWRNRCQELEEFWKWKGTDNFINKEKKEVFPWEMGEMYDEEKFLSMKIYLKPHSLLFKELKQVKDLA